MRSTEALVPTGAPARPKVRAGVIADGRRLQRRRRLRAALAAFALAAVAAGGAALLLRGGDGPTTRPAASRPVPVAPGRLLTRMPYLGLACRLPNAVACDRVGLAVWLRHPAVSVTAAIAGRGLTLDDPEWSGGARTGRRTLFAGFLQPAGLVERLHVHPDRRGRWIGRDAPSPVVRLTVHRAAGPDAVTQLAVPLMAGWG